MNLTHLTLPVCLLVSMMNLTHLTLPVCFLVSRCAGQQGEEEGHPGPEAKQPALSPGA